MWHDYVQNTEISRTGLPPVSYWIFTGRNAIFEPMTQPGNIHPVVRVLSGPVRSTVTTTAFLLPPSGGRLLVTVT